VATLETRLCKCGEIYEILTHRGEAVNMDDEAEGVLCPKCGSEEFAVQVGAGTGINLGDEGGYSKHYPYFDRALNCRVSSAAHRKKLCKERGLIPVDGDMEIENKEETVWREGAERKWKDLQDRYDNHPDFADFRRLRDKGFYEDEARRQKDARRNR